MRVTTAALVTAYCGVPRRGDTPPLPDEDTSAEIEDVLEDALVKAGYRHYETSAFAKTGRECRHNLNYWQFGDYLGIGAGAHSKLSFPERIVRQIRHRQPQQYLAAVASGTPLAEQRELSRADVGFEFMLNALRLTEMDPPVRDISYFDTVIQRFALRVRPPKAPGQLLSGAADEQR